MKDALECFCLLLDDGIVGELRIALNERKLADSIENFLITYA